VLFWHDLAVFGDFLEVLSHGGKGKLARKHRAHGKSGVSSPRGASGNSTPKMIYLGSHARYAPYVFLSRKGGLEFEKQVKVRFGSPHRHPFCGPIPFTEPAMSLMPEEYDKALGEIPREPEQIDLVKQLSGAGPLPPR
jgi:hypothetical protein